LGRARARARVCRQRRVRLLSCRRRAALVRRPERLHRRLRRCDTLEQMKQQILGTAPVLCDRPAWILFGVSLAGWNLLASLIMTGCCVAALLYGARRRGVALGAPRGLA